MKDAVSVEVGDALEELLHVAAHQVQGKAHAILIKKFLEILLKSIVHLITVLSLYKHQYSSCCKRIQVKDKNWALLTKECILFIFTFKVGREYLSIDTHTFKDGDNGLIFR